MEKQYYFLSGFFRSGNTVLSAILNQNPKIHSSPISGLIEHINQSDLISENFEDAIRNAVALGGDSDTQAAIAGGIAEAFYRDIPEHIWEPCVKKLNPEILDLIDNFYSKLS